MPQRKLTGTQNPMTKVSYDDKKLASYPSAPQTDGLVAWLDWADVVQRDTSMSRGMIAVACGVKPQYLTNVLHGTIQASASKFDMMRNYWADFQQIVPCLSHEWARSKQTMMVSLMELEAFFRDPDVRSGFTSYESKLDKKKADELMREYCAMWRQDVLRMDSLLVYHGVRSEGIESWMWQAVSSLDPLSACLYMMKHSAGKNSYPIMHHFEFMDHPRIFWEALAKDPAVEARYELMLEEQMEWFKGLHYSLWEPWPDESYDQVIWSEQPRVMTQMTDADIYEGLGMDPFLPADGEAS